jgi:uncharacterized membrane protein YfcA|tara:strand:+ start:422 stop:1216 length:795 start_codon:yes stop_codon:yes gene_type:complete
MSCVDIFLYFWALLIGLVIGLFGGGGSILAVPVFVYIFHLNPILATSYSLFVVGFSAAVGTLININKKLIVYKTALVFSLPALGSVFFSRRYIITNLPDILFDLGFVLVTKEMALMLLFSSVIILSAISILKNNKLAVSHKPKTINYNLLFIVGLGVGLLTGLVGAGGGFIIVPALVLFANLDVKQAVATSLIIITFNALFGFVADITQVAIDWRFLIIFTSVSICGIFIGSYVSNFIEEKSLKNNFARFMLLMAILIIYNEFQ